MTALIAEFRKEQSKDYDLIQREREDIDDLIATLEQWREAFDMVLNEDGRWTWDPFIENHHKLVDRYYDLLKRWNRNVAAMSPRPRDLGRPLAANEDQVADVLSCTRTGSRCARSRC